VRREKFSGQDLAVQQGSRNQQPFPYRDSASTWDRASDFRFSGRCGEWKIEAEATDRTPGEYFQETGTELSTTRTVLPSTGTVLSGTGTELSGVRTVLSSTGIVLSGSGTELPGVRTVLSATETQLPSTGTVLSNTETALSGHQAALGSSDLASLIHDFEPLLGENGGGEGS
jgi:hypothetical protein